MSDSGKNEEEGDIEMPSSGTSKEEEDVGSRSIWLRVFPFIHVFKIEILFLAIKFFK